LKRKFSYQQNDVPAYLKIFQAKNPSMRNPTHRASTSKASFRQNQATVWRQTGFGNIQSELLENKKVLAEANTRICNNHI
jgi:hypothetical protein